MTGRLPAELTSFVGREDLLGLLRRLVSTHSSAPRLLTLTGPGGTGKTRVALQLARAVADEFEDGVHFVPLAAISDPHLVLSSIAQALGVLEADNRPPRDALKSYLQLGERHVLLVLDNFEQLLPAAAELPELLAACPNLRVVVTSRAALRVSGEREVAIAPLSLGEARQLFLERAQSVRGDFQLSPAVDEICQRLDGLPLAIELAAARTRVLDADAVLGRLTHRLQFLTGGPRDAPARQQTLRNTIVWSYDLLDPEEQALFRTVAIFVGGCTLDALQYVSDTDVNVLELTDSLCAKSLLQSLPGPPGHLRVGLLETTREFGVEQLAWTGELQALRRRHAEYYVALAEEAEPRLWGPDAGIWIERLEVELDNIRAALEWALATATESSLELALRMLGALWRFCWTRSHGTEALQWSRRAFAAAPRRTRARMKALYGAAWHAHFEWDSTAARAYLDESLSIAQQIGDDWTVAWVLHVLGRVAYFDGNYLTATERGQQALEIAERLDDQSLVGWTLHLLGLAAHIARDYARADELYARSLAIRESLGHTEMIGVLYQLMGISAYRQGDVVRARQLYRSYLEIGRSLGSSFHLTNVMAQLACLAATQQQPARAARLFGATAATSESSRTRPIPLAYELIGEGLEMARTALGSRFAAAFERGRSLSLREAVDEALQVELASAASCHSHSVSVLTERERQVAALVQRGMTNRQIAAELVVTERTAAAHIEHILDKLGFTSRAQIAAWAAAQSPPN